MRLHQALSLLLTTEQGSRIVLAFAGVFSILAVLGLALILSDWWADLQLASTQKAVIQARALWSSSLGELVHTIPAAHLLGYRAEASASIPITSSELRLTGIIHQEMEEGEGGNAFSKAIISVKGGVGKVYQAGENLQEGVQLTEIQSEAVILNHNGHSERLPLQRTRLRGN